MAREVIVALMAEGNVVIMAAVVSPLRKGDFVLLTGEVNAVYIADASKELKLVNSVLRIAI